MTLTRFGFFGALLAAIAAKAQDIVITPCRPKIVWGNLPKLCNGQCPNPECAYMAPPFPKWPERLAHGVQDWEAYDKLHSWPLGRIIRAFEPPGIDMYAEARLNRCPKCSTAFWQDPQKGD